MPDAKLHIIFLPMFTFTASAAIKVLKRKFFAKSFIGPPAYLLYKPCLIYVLVMIDDVFQYLYHFCLTEIVQNVTVNPAASQGSLF